MAASELIYGDTFGIKGVRTLNKSFDRLVLATGNRYKYEEFLELLPRDVVKKLLFAPDLPEAVKIPEVDETGSTYAMNAVLKAAAWSAASGLPSLADDSGIEVPALGWEPGVRSSRVFDGKRFLSSDAERNQWLLTRMEGSADRRASFVAAVALSMPGEWTLVCEGVCDGRLAAAETGKHGFGYDPLFIPDGCDVSFGELPRSVKNQISHRAGAVNVLLDILQNHAIGL